MNRRSFALSLLFLGCSTRTTLIPLTTGSDLNQIPHISDYEKVRLKNSARYEMNLGRVNPSPAADGAEWPKKRPLYPENEKKIIFTVTVWDLPLIKAYLDKKSPSDQPDAGAKETLKARLLKDHQDYTQILLQVDSTLEDRFRWGEWSYRLEDSQGGVYAPLKTYEAVSEEVIYPKETLVMGKKEERAAYSVYHDHGTLYFRKIDLLKLTSVKFVISALDNKRSIYFKFRFKKVA